jgi:predicted nucleic acid-binding protein
MKIYVDTNWFLSFYQSNHERRHVLDEARRRANLIVLTEQNVTEYRKNRTSLAKALRNNIENVYARTAVHDQPLARSR